MRIDHLEFVRDYLGVPEEQCPAFLVRYRSVIDRLIGRYGIPLSERMARAKTKATVPYKYGKDDYEMMLLQDFGKFGGTENARLVEKFGDIVVYTFDDITLKADADVSVKTNVIPASSQSALSGIEFKAKKKQDSISMLFDVRIEED
jgi:hypothetical protein